MKIKSLTLLFVTTVLLAFFYFLISGNDSSLKTGSGDFALNSASNFNKIEVKDWEGNTALVYKNNKWVTADESEADQRRVIQAIQLLINLEMQYPLSVSETESIGDSLKQFGNIITIYKDKKQVYQLRYFSYRNRNIALDKKKAPFVIAVKGESDMLLSDVFSSNPKSWLGNLVCDIPYHEILTLKLELHDEHTGFIIEQKSDTVVFKSLSGNETVNVSSQQIYDYLHFFRGITFSPMVDDNDVLVKGHKAFFNLEIARKNNETITIEGYRQIRKDDKTPDPYRFTGIVNKTDTLIFSYSVFDPILVGPEYFSKK